jgi:hypothetical protein
MKTLLIVMLFCVTLPMSFASSFCERNVHDITDLLADVSNRIDFKNQGGLFNGGVCWWHSRLQRSSIYLTRFAKKAPRPNAKQMKQILLALKNLNQVVVIPGYENFNSFTQENQKAVQSLLDLWQREDGFLNFEWMRGLSGHSSLPPREMEAQMQKLYHYYQTSPVPVWVMAQMKGIIAHSFLIRHMEVTPDGFDLEVIDSNKPKELRMIHYQVGDQTIVFEGSKIPFVPYVGFQEDFNRLGQAIKNHCKNQKSFIEDDLIPETIERGEIELDQVKRP